jgi:hypothetical protein
MGMEVRHGVAEGLVVHGQLAAEDPLVELHGLAGVAVEGDVRIEPRAIPCSFAVEIASAGT